MAATSTQQIALITGIAGFIGAFLGKRLLEEGWTVIGYDNLNDYYDVSLKRERLDMLQEASGNSGRFVFTHADLCDAEALEGVFRQWRIDVVVNLAAQAGVRYSINHPRSYVDSNLVGFLNILEACRHHGIDHLVFASSSSVYGDTETVPFVETAPCNEPVSLYAATKKSNEMMAHAYAATFGLHCTGLRFFTVYGPMGRPDMAYFSFADKMITGKPIPLFNHGEMLRDFTYIDDIVEGIYRIITGGFKNDDRDAVPYRVFNIGHGDPVPLRAFVGELEHALGNCGLLKHEASYRYLPMQPGDVHRTFADTTALRKAYGYTANTPLETGMKAFAEWYAKHLRDDAARDNAGAE